MPDPCLLTAPTMPPSPVDNRKGTPRSSMDENLKRQNKVVTNLRSSFSRCGFCEEGSVNLAAVHANASHLGARSQWKRSRKIVACFPLPNSLIWIPPTSLSFRISEANNADIISLHNFTTIYAALHCIRTYTVTVNNRNIFRYLQGPTKMYLEDSTT